MEIGKMKKMIENVSMDMEGKVNEIMNIYDEKIRNIKEKGEKVEKENGQLKKQLELNRWLMEDYVSRLMTKSQ
jgi:hypothetical protein